MKAPNKNLNSLQIFFCLFSIFLCGLSEISKYLNIGTAGSVIGKLLIASPILPVVFLLPTILNTVGLPPRGKEYRLGKFSFNVILLVFIIGSFVGIIYPISTQTPFYNQYYFPDALVILSPCQWILVFPYLFNSGKDKIVLNSFIIQVIIILFGVFLSSHKEQLYLSSFVPALILAYLIIQLVNPHKKPLSYLWFFLEFLIISYLLLFYSLGYQRISFVAFICILILTLAILSFTIYKKYFLLMFTAIFICLFILLDNNLLFNIINITDSDFSRSRFYQTLVNKEAFTDESSNSRIDEMQDCLNIILDDFPSSILGYGHGASYKPTLSPIISNATAEGLIHNIHVGPVLLLFRYGFFGIIFYLLLVRILWQGFWNIIRYINNYTNFPKQLLLLYIMSYLNLLAIFVKFHAQNTLIDPMFAICMGIVCTPLNVKKSKET